MMYKIAIFKIGGRILDNSKDLTTTVAQLTQLYEDQIIKKIILIPGGGTNVNLIRELYNEFQINDELAHWMAIYSMDYNGIVLNKKLNLNQLNKQTKTYLRNGLELNLLLLYVLEEFMQGFYKN